jgi:hypothetical protein
VSCLRGKENIKHTKDSDALRTRYASPMSRYNISITSCHEGKPRVPLIQMRCKYKLYNEEDLPSNWQLWNEAMTGYDIH